VEPYDSLSLRVQLYKSYCRSNNIKRNVQINKGNKFLGEVAYAASKVAYAHCEVAYAALSSNLSLSARNGILN
jgi:hypothetical protein